MGLSDNLRLPQSQVISASLTFTRYEFAISPTTPKAVYPSFRLNLISFPSALGSKLSSMCATRDLQPRSISIYRSTTRGTDHRQLRGSGWCFLSTPLFRHVCVHRR